MEYMKDWLKSILYMNVLLILVKNLMQKTKYESYLRFFSGILLVLCLMKPLLDLSGNEQLMNASFLKNQWENEWKLISRTGELKQAGESLRKEYTKAVKAQVIQMAKADGWEEPEVEIGWDEEEAGIVSITVRGEAEKTKDSKVLRETLEQYYGLSPGMVHVISDG